MWVITDDMLKGWNVPLKDRLNYIRIRQERKKDKYSKLVAFLISFFVGCLGADWFYLSAGSGGYIFAGIIKLLTGGGLGMGIVKLSVRYYFTH